MTTVAAFSVTPLGLGDSVAGTVALAVQVVRESGLANETNAMFTNVEGSSLEEVFDVIRRAVEAVAVAAPRVSVVVKIDHRPDVPPGALRSKVERIEDELGGR